MATTYVDAAGPTGAPAVIVHPEQELPKVWRVLSTWEQDGQRGAWLEHALDWRGNRQIAQVVYGEATIYRPGNFGNALGGAVGRLCCLSVVTDTYGARAEEDHPDRLARLAHYAERGIREQDQVRLDWYAYRLYVANGKPGLDDGFGGTPTPAITDVPAPEPTDSDLIVKAVALGVAMHEVRLHPDAGWPAGWEKVKDGQTDWAYRAPVDWVPIIWTADTPLRTQRGTLMALSSWQHKQFDRIYEAEQAGSPATATPAATPAPPRRRVGPPPKPGLERARWLGERITEMASDEDNSYSAHVRRRIAAHRAQSIAAGYSAANADNDGPLLYGPLSLHLEGLNAYAGRVFAGEQDPIGGTDNAVL